ncbi:UDP-glucose 4-epimerase GalE [Fluviicola sp.]|jgi:UDP-glucose 4-epimerase|uniref:UDP-glucose 4-epimerase GalE n=1 Tax=Fluviicola sp. TaxID=1917219 RepID=UPI00282B1B94|nr:UDP-glucose 4-epimerase GalE [Fluviicola sp.]MDR0801916.1 UDP-glucose 4-epimerase GalE [Fluviicola sp.]
MKEKKEILVTGGTGFIGSHTVVELLELGYQPVIFDNCSNSSKAIIKQIALITGKECAFYKGDMRDKALLRSVFEKYSIQGVIHFAACKAVAESVAKPLHYYDNNLISLLNLFACMEEFQVNKLVFSSSCTVYGVENSIEPLNETMPMGKPNSPYGWTKWMAEQMLIDIAGKSALRPVILRYFNPIGAHPGGKLGEMPNGVPNNVLPYITQTAAGLREELTIFGNDYQTPDGTCVRDYIHVTDVAKAHVRALEFPVEGTLDVFNLGTGKGTSVLELVRIFEKLTGKPLNYRFGARRPGDVDALYADVSKAKKFLNWNTERTIEDAILDAWKWEQYRLKNEIF